MSANPLKAAAFTAMLGMAAIAASATSADTYKIGCHGNDCVRVECDDRGRNCFRLGYIERSALPAGTPYEETDAYEDSRGSFLGFPRDPDTDYNPYRGLFDSNPNTLDPDSDYNPYKGLFDSNPDTLDPDNDYDEYPGLYFHDRNHFDPDNDYDSYQGW